LSVPVFIHTFNYPDLLTARLGVTEKIGKMQQNRLLTLLTDFGLQDVYVGVMKGAIAQIAPTLNVVDLTHQIPPQNLVAARFCLLNAVPYFPDGTVHVAVVDPGVGSRRRAIAVQFSGGFLVGPDNGLFSGVLEQWPAIAAVELTCPDYWRTPSPSHTFHGRDIFAPVGAHLACGVPLDRIGRAIAPEALISFPIPPYTQTGNHLNGSIQYADRFGNLITNIPSKAVLGQPWSVVVPVANANAETDISLKSSPTLTLPASQTYNDHPPGTPLALVGSHGWVEIAVNQGSAQTQLQLTCGDLIEILLLD